MSDQQFIDHKLLSRIDACLTTTGMSPTEFGLKAINDKRLIPDLREGRELRRATREKIEQFIAEQTEPAKPTRKVRQ